MEKIFLKHPLELKNKETGEVVQRIDHVVMVRLKTGAYLNALDEAGSKQGSLMRALLCRAARLSAESVDRLELEDFMTLAKELESFLPSGLKTGASGSSLSPEPSGFPQDGSDGDPLN
jgi:hypothetical protein